MVGEWGMGDECILASERYIGIWLEYSVPTVLLPTNNVGGEVISLRSVVD